MCFGRHFARLKYEACLFSNLNLTEIYIKLLKSIGNYMYQLLQK
jgi:hypothetical protein